MKMLTFVTFGQGHVHIIYGKTFDRDCIGVIEANDCEHGRELAFEYFGPKFCFEYCAKDFDFRKTKYFPAGFISVNF